MLAIDLIFLELVIAVSLVIILPLLPAILIYKLLPHSQSDATGPFQGLKIKLGGAFGGYFITALLMLVVFKTIKPTSWDEANRKAQELNQKLNDAQSTLQQAQNSSSELAKQLDKLKADYDRAQEEIKHYKVWKVSGTVHAGKDPQHKLTISVHPPPSINADGRFSVLVVESKGVPTPDFPSLQLDEDGYYSQPVYLVKSDDVDTYEIVPDDEHHTIEVKKPISLTEDPQFKERQKPAQPVVRSESSSEPPSHP